MQRVSIAGIPGAGNTTLARALADRLGVPHIELDALNHGPGWTEATPVELRDRVEAALSATTTGWVADGNYHRKLGDLIVSRVDTFVWIDLPLALSLSRIEFGLTRLSLSLRARRRPASRPCSRARCSRRRSSRTESARRRR